MKYCSKSPVVDEQWLETDVSLEQLYERLGAPQADITNFLLPEDGQDVVQLIFETEVKDTCNVWSQY